MNWDRFYAKIADLAVLDLPLAARILELPNPQTARQLARWVKAGRLVALRRGLFAPAPLYRKRPLSPLWVANQIYRPSYLSGLWALSFYDLIPEKTVVFTSVTTRVTRSFANSLGEFAYSSLRRDLFRNFAKRDISGDDVWIAEPEKALLDHWHLTPGEWGEARMEEMRYQNREAANGNRLVTYSQGYPPRVRRAAALWIAHEEGKMEEA